MYYRIIIHGEVERMTVRAQKTGGVESPRCKGSTLHTKCYDTV